MPFPSENQFSEAKRVLGKALFWDEQLSTDNTMACGTCHIPGSGGTDPRIAINPGLDGITPSADDKRASPGMIGQDSSLNYASMDFFGLSPQVTSRRANPSVMAMYAPNLFWDGRATSEFRDPQTGEVVIAVGGALESQAAGPVLSDVEMAHQNRDWDHVTEKLSTAIPLNLAFNLPADLQTAVDEAGDYPAMFEAAFGDGEITAARIAMAIATYERTLVPDQTPWDAFMQGDNTAMTAAQVRGWNAFQGSRCNQCHTAPLFTDLSFPNVGSRPINEDSGRQEVTGNFNDRGKFKVPSLRNVGLESGYMHNGQFNSIGQVLAFYRNAGGQQFPPNRDPLLNNPIAFPPNVNTDVIDFLNNALTDARVANEQFPFDRPSLHSERTPGNPRLQNGGTPGSGGFIPAMVANMPPLIGDETFKVGIDFGLPGANAWLAVSQSAPVNGVVARDEMLGPITLGGLLTGEGFGTMRWPIPAGAAMDGERYFMQWIVEDPAGISGEALSRVARVTLICGDCSEPACPADMNSDEVLNFFDVAAFLQAFTDQEAAADFNSNGVFDFFDVQLFLQAFSSGCP